MIRLDKIYTKGGDKGETSLSDGTRVAKHDLRVESYGTVDEANSFIGVARLHASENLGDILRRIQNDLFDMGADLARPISDEEENQNNLRITPAQVTWLEQQIDIHNEKLEPLTSFVLPGGSIAASHLHVARAVTRRAERLVTELAANETLNAAVIHYLNRLSDFLFVVARLANDGGASDVLWQPGASQSEVSDSEE